jgi:hypothetical protein
MRRLSILFFVLPLCPLLAIGCKTTPYNYAVSVTVPASESSADTILDAAKSVLDGEKLQYYAAPRNNGGWTLVTSWKVFYSGADKALNFANVFTPTEPYENHVSYLQYRIDITPASCHIAAFTTVEPDTANAVTPVYPGSKVWQSVQALARAITREAGFDYYDIKTVRVTHE